MAADPVPAFTASGLASGLDTNSIIDNLVKIESQPLTDLQTQETGFKTQVSLIAQLVTKVQTFYSAAKALSDSGVLGVKTTSVNNDFTATPGTGATAGTYTVSVQDLATAELDRSQAYSDPSAPVRGGTLQVNVQGTSYGSITVHDGETLQNVANDLNTMGAPINASVLSDGNGNTYLSVSNKDTGFTTSNASDALQLVMTADPAATQGTVLSFGEVHTATNAKFTVDDLPFTRQSNNVTDVIPGTSLQLKGKTNTEETLSMDTDTSTTATNLQKFVDAYNDIINTAKADQNVPDGTSRDATLAGDSTVRDLVASIQSILTTPVAGLGSVSTMADLGIKTNFQDGTISIDSTKLASAIAQDPTAVNTIFNDPVSGISAQSFDFSEKFTSVVDGVFTARTNGLNDQIKNMDSQASDMQARIDSYRANLVTQFTAMETLVSGFKATGNFLTQQSSASANGG